MSFASAAGASGKKAADRYAASALHAAVRGDQDGLRRICQDLAGQDPDTVCTVTGGWAFAIAAHGGVLGLDLPLDPAALTDAAGLPPGTAGDPLMTDVAAFATALVSGDAETMTRIIVPPGTGETDPRLLAAMVTLVAALSPSPEKSATPLKTSPANQSSAQGRTRHASNPPNLA